MYTSVPASPAACAVSRSNNSRRGSAPPTGVRTARSERAVDYNARVDNTNTMCTAAQLAAFKRRLAKVDPVLANLIRAAGEFTHTLNADHTPFHALARAIAHQQLNGTAAESIFKRFVGLYGTEEKRSEGRRGG